MICCTCYLDRALHGEEDVVRLDVPVHHVPLVQVVQALEHLPAHSRHLISGWGNRNISQLILIKYSMVPMEILRSQIYSMS